MSLHVKQVLNVGSGKEQISLPSVYAGWHKVRLDVNPATMPDVLCDARKLHNLPAEMYDSVYCSHALEHFYAHEVLTVVSGFKHVLKPDGFVFIAVPDLGGLFKEVVEKGLGLLDTLYDSEIGPVTVRDVLYGHAGLVARDNIWQSHKTGFTQEALGHLMQGLFPYVYTRVTNREVHVIASMVAEVRLAA